MPEQTAKPLPDRGPEGPIRDGRYDNHGNNGTQGGVSPQVPREPGQTGPYPSSGEDRR